MIKAYFRNPHITEDHYIVKDASNDSIVLDQRVGAQEQVAVTLQASSAGIAEAFYRRADQTGWTHKSGILEGSVVAMS